MAMPAWIPEAWSKLSADNQKKAESIIHDLLTELGNEATEPRKTKIRYDVLKGKITVAENFYDPLSEFEEYM